MSHFPFILTALFSSLIIMVIGAVIKNELVQHLGYSLLICGVLWYFVQRHKHLAAKAVANEDPEE